MRPVFLHYRELMVVYDDLPYLPEGDLMAKRTRLDRFKELARGLSTEELAEANTFTHKLAALSDKALELRTKTAEVLDMDGDAEVEERS